ncbi:MAG: hypothetical protein RSB96_02695 [Oscillospiraceae bacterium]
MKKAIHDLFISNVPILAECGGFMYLCKNLVTLQGQSYPMVGAIDSTATMQTRLSRFGYASLIAKEDGLLAKKGQSIYCHEFHYSDSDNNGTNFTAQKHTGIQYDCIHTNKNLYAGYPHLHLWSNIAFAKNFINQCKESKYEVRTSHLNNTTNL